MVEASLMVFELCLEGGRNEELQTGESFVDSKSFLTQAWMEILDRWHIVQRDNFKIQNFSEGIVYRRAVNVLYYAI